MSKVSELAYDIEQLYIEGFSPKSIATQLGCPISLVYDWLAEVGMDGTGDIETIEPDEDTYEDDSSYFGA